MSLTCCISSAAVTLRNRRNGRPETYVLVGELRAGGAIIPTLIEGPTRIEAAGTVPKSIEEFVGRANTGAVAVSIARMVSPAGWEEPGQRPEFDEWSIVLRGVLVVEHDDGRVEVGAGQAVHTRPGEWVRYSTPYEGGAEYVAVCVPAFTPDTVHRDEDGTHAT